MTAPVTIRTIIAILLLFLSFGIITTILALDINESNRDIVMVLIGNLSGWVMGILSYYFGSSHVPISPGTTTKTNTENKTTTNNETN